MRRCTRRALGAILVLLLMMPAFEALARPVKKKPPAKKPAAAVTCQVKETEELWAMPDGVKLPVSVFSPAPGITGEKFPVVVFVHPWDTDKAIFDKTAAKYASRGYVAVTYTVRGWFGAEGSINCVDPDCEMQDLRDIITLVSEDARFPVLKDAKGPVVGVTGYSMGGVHSFLIAPRRDPRQGDPGDPRVRAVVPMHGGADLLFSIYPNGAVKWFWATMLLAGGYIGNMAGAMINMVGIINDPGLDPWRKLTSVFNVVTSWRPLFNNVTPELARIYAIATQRQVALEDEARMYMKKRSARWWCDEELDGKIEHPIDAPMLIVAGWKDDLFNANEGLSVFNSMIDAPKRIIITNNGHAGGFAMPFNIQAPENAELKWIEREIAMWFDHFLKGASNGVEGEPAVSYYRDWNPASYGASDRWPVAGTKDATYYLGAGARFREGNLTNEPQASAPPDLLVNIGFGGSISLPYFNDATKLVGGQPMDIPERIDLLNMPFGKYGYVSQPLESDTVIGGTPRLSLSYESSNQFTQLIPRLYEVSPDGLETLISRGWYEGHDERAWTRTGTGDHPAEMAACCHRVAAGSRLKLELSTSDMIQTWPLWGLSFINILHDSSIIIPINNGPQI